MGDEGEAQNEYYGNESVACPSWAPIVGYAGVTAAVVLSSKFLRVLFIKRTFSNVMLLLRFGRSLWNNKGWTRNYGAWNTLT